MIGYAYAEFDATAGEAVLACGAYDGLRLWLNGEVILSMDQQRDFCPGHERIAVHLREGRNRVLVKCETYTGRWGIRVGIDQGQRQAVIAAGAAGAALSAQR